MLSENATLDEIRAYFKEDQFATQAAGCTIVACNVGEQPTVSVSNTIEFLSSAKGTKLIAECSVDKSGRKLGFYTVDVSDDTGRHIARMTATCFR